MTESMETLVTSRLENVAEARAFIADTLRRWHLDHLVRPVVLIGHELMANALCHGDPPVHLRLLLQDGTVVVEVTDAGARMPRIVEIDNSMSTSGRGLRIIATLASRWGVRRHEVGKTVWAEIPTAE